MLSFSHAHTLQMNLLGILMSKESSFGGLLFLFTVSSFPSSYSPSLILSLSLSLVVFVACYSCLQFPLSLSHFSHSLLFSLFLSLVKSFSYYYLSRDLFISYSLTLIILLILSFSLSYCLITLFLSFFSFSRLSRIVCEQSSQMILVGLQ